MTHPPDFPQPSAAPRPGPDAGRAVPPPFADSDPPESDPAFDRSKRRWLAVLNLLAVFAVGAGAGIAAAWWMGNLPSQVVRPPPQVAQPAPSAPRAQHPLPARPAPPDVPAATPRMPSGEYPYDGLATDPEGTFVPRIPYRIEPLPEMAETPGGGEEGEASAAGELKEKASGDSAEASGANAAAGADEPKKAAVESAPEKDSTKSAASKPAKKPVKIASRTKHDPGAPARTRPTKGEIERIRQQATDELWRKRVRERMPDEGSADGLHGPVAAGAHPG